MSTPSAARAAYCSRLASRVGAPCAMVQTLPASTPYRERRRSRAVSVMTRPPIGPGHDRSRTLR